MVSSVPWLGSLVGLPLLLLAACPPLQAASNEDLIRLLDRGACQGCRLQDADLVHAALRDADLRRAQLQRANLSGAQLEGAKLAGANLSYASLVGASLQGADLRGADLTGTDLRQANLAGALLDPNALSRSHWQLAKGVDPGQQSYAELHNAGVAAAQEGRQPQAEILFGEAIRKQPEAGISWVARGLMRLEQGKIDLASQDFTYAAGLYQQAGDEDKMKQLQELAKSIQENPKGSKGGNGVGSQLVQGAMSAFQALAPLAIKAFAGL